MASQPKTFFLLTKKAVKESTYCGGESDTSFLALIFSCTYGGGNIKQILVVYSLVVLTLLLLYVCVRGIAYSKGFHCLL